MRFTRLRLNGFKSFVDPTDLVIHDGLTGIVGPNGCGKSNLLEALRWVMGENRPTAMRGAGMEDVVFAGSGMRRARAFAEVALSLDNSERLAPAGFNEADMLEVTRRLTRDAGSAYRINGKEVRARDVQMLFADASTGAHSPALVRQGQISELINARPRARRRVLEEAAGISGLYQRRHEAELRLSATETNLARVSDTIEALAQQLATLNRQARQAARYREIGAALRRAEGLLLCRRLHEAETASQARRSELAEASTAAARAEREAREAATAREAAEAALPPKREEEAIAGAVLQRLSVQRESLDAEEARARQAVQELSARIEQMQRDAEREAALAGDADDTIARLEWEEAALEEAGEGHAARLAEAESAATEAREAANEAEAQLAKATEALAELSARHQALERQAAEARAVCARIASAEAKAREQASVAETRLQAAQAAQESAESEADEAQETLEAADEALAGTGTSRAEAEQTEAEARARKAEAKGAAGALNAELRALERIIAQEARDGTALLDAVRVAPGLEAALGAALGPDLDLPAAEHGSGWRALPPLETLPPLPAGAEPLASHVQAPPELARRLSLLGLVAAANAPALHKSLAPGQRLVTREGDLWRWDGLMQRADDAPSAAALRLAQINRLEALQADLDEAQALAGEAAALHETHAEALAAATAADRTARDARRNAESRLSEARRTLSRAEAEASQATTSLANARAETARLSDEAGKVAKQQAEAEAALAELSDPHAARAALEAMRSKVETARGEAMTRRAALDTCRRDGEARNRRLQDVARETASWRTRKDSAGNRLAELERRREEASAALEDAAAAPEEIAASRETLATQITTAETRRTTATEALLEAERILRAAQEGERNAERAAGEAREARAAAQARADAALDAVSHAAAQIEEAHECSPDELLRALDANVADMPALDTLETEIARLRRARDALGAVNLRAEEDARALGGEHELLVKERADLEAAVAKLRAGISALNREGRERLLAAFERVNENFTALFTHLFGGGEARLVLVESDDPLEAGLEIMCQPPGKKLSTLSLLSGGEQTLTALALIFAVFLANPAPICVLDEVDAPLDDANVSRFCDLLDEMTRRTETRFLIITHNAITMARMDRLFGVTMAEQGVSQLVSVDLKRAEAMVA